MMWLVSSASPGLLDRELAPRYRVREQAPPASSNARQGMGSRAQGLRKPLAILVLTTALTVLVWLESFLPPWAPFFLIYAILAIAIPLWARSYRLGSAKEAFITRWKLFLALLTLTLLVDLGLSLTYELALHAIGLAGHPYYDLGAALEALARAAAKRFGTTPEVAILIYALYILIWAPVGEELFYRGYMYGGLRERWHPVAAALVSSAFFGIRHATHLALLSPFPVLAASWWAFHAFCFGLVMAYAYERSGTLYVPAAAHFIANLVSLLL